ncbi:head-tail connector protein [Ruminococcaceae bacterium OttesenSCG-928-I18]|nr:head-tail connector protein [Ruminococcaceae bacterium OttesenSCG-928-I18]
MADNTEPAEELRPVTLQEARDFCSDDIQDEANDRTLTMLIKAADRYLQDALGKEYDIDDERAKLLALSLVDEWYNAGAKTQKVSASIEKMKSDFLFQIRVGAKGAQENG